MYTTIRLNAGNDRNGNPRRLFVAFDNGNIVAVYPDDFMGTSAITHRGHLVAYRGVSFEITPREYRSLLKQAHDVELREEKRERDASCDQCEAMMIQGVYTHELGCPNNSKVKVDGRWVTPEDDAEEEDEPGLYECAECGHTDHPTSECPNVDSSGDAEEVEE